MPFMLLTLGVVVVMTVIAFLRTSPHVANPNAVLAFNVATLAVSVPVAVAVGLWLYDSAVVVKANEKGMATYLAITAGGAAALIAVAVAGFVRNFAVFPLSRRIAQPAQPHES